MKIKLTTVFLLGAVFAACLVTPAFAITEADVEAQVSSVGREAVTGNVLVWFLCAVAFLKVSQKIDSFISNLGISVGRTGGSLLAEAMIAMRAVTMVVGGRGGGASCAGSAAGGAAESSSSSGMAGFFKGGLIGMAGRHITNSAVKTATTQTSAVHTVQNSVGQAADAAVQTAADAPINNEVHTGGSSIHTENNAASGTPPQEGVIVTGRGVSSQTTTADGVPPLGPDPAPSNAPPQDGVILAGGEAPISGVPADMETPVMDVPADSVPVDLTPSQDGVTTDITLPQEGTIVTDGDTSIHAPQTGDTVSVSPASPASPTSPAGTGGERHTQASSERVQVSHTVASSEKAQASHAFVRGGAVPTLGGMVFSHSLAAGGSFANDVIGTVARGEVAGSITGDMAAQALHSYMGYTAKDSEAARQTSFRDVEIGGGRITGVEYSPAHPEGIAFSMYHAGQYTKPEGDYQRGITADGQAWYRQYAVDTVQRTPFKAPDGTIAYDERIVKRVPKPPMRKDRI